jgi:hypothetical protein
MEASSLLLSQETLRVKPHRESFSNHRPAGAVSLCKRTKWMSLSLKEQYKTRQIRIQDQLYLTLFSSYHLDKSSSTITPRLWKESLVSSLLFRACRGILPKRKPLRGLVEIQWKISSLYLTYRTKVNQKQSYLVMKRFQLTWNRMKVLELTELIG